MAEGFVFAYLGLTFFSYKTLMWSMDLIVVEFIVILTGRFLGTFGLIGVLKLCCKYEKNNKNAITLRELLFIWYAGLIRGAIAFGLVLRISPEFPNRDVIVTTCLTLVVFTTIFFGSTVGILGKWLFPKAEAEHSSIEAESEQESYQFSSDDKVSQIAEPLVHYNIQDEAHSSEEEEGSQKKQKQKRGNKGCGLYIQRLDQLILRPIFIYKYEKDKEERAAAFYDMFEHEGTEIEKMFRKAAMEDKKGAAANASQRSGGSHTASYLFKAMTKCDDTATRRKSVLKYEPEGEENP